MKIHFDQPRRRNRYWLVAVAALAPALLAVLAMGDRPEPPPAALHSASPASSALEIAKDAPPIARAPDLKSATAPPPPASPGKSRCASLFATARGSVSEPEGERDAAALAAHNRVLNMLRSLGDDVSLALAHMADENNEAARTGELARLAHRSREPAVMLLALNSCRAEKHADCAGLSAEEWHQRDPNSAWPWLQLAESAFSRGDSRAADVALQRAAAASWDGLDASLKPVFGLPEADDAALIEKWKVVTMALSAQHMVQGMAGAAAVGCRKWHLADGGTVKRPPSEALAGCRALAEKLSTGQTRSDRFRAYAVGEVVGWPPERVANARAEMRALQDFAIRSYDSLPKAEDCATVRTMMDLVHESVSQGDIPATQRRMRAAGVTIEQLIAQRRASEASQAGSSADKGSAEAR